MNIDHDVYEILKDFEQRAAATGIDLTITGLSTLRRSNDAMHRVEDGAGRRCRRRSWPEPDAERFTHSRDHELTEIHADTDQRHPDDADAAAGLRHPGAKAIVASSTTCASNRNLLQQVNETSEGQYPFAIVLSCIDSRTSAELVFDQGLGDIFSVRIAGNVLNEDILGSMEFACHVAGSKLIVVLGHTKCGAVKGACSHVELGHLTGLLGKIAPAIHDRRSSERERAGARHLRRTRGGREHPPPAAGDSRSQLDPCSTSFRRAGSAWPGASTRSSRARSRSSSSGSTRRNADSEAALTSVSA